VVGKACGRKGVQTGKSFFFEKKNQKTFAPGGWYHTAARAQAANWRMARISDNVPEQNGFPFFI
jgi:hypothetical protein